MSRNSLHLKTIDFSSIERINDGVLVLKHFLKLNQELLPIYYSLHSKETKSNYNLKTIEKIDELFHSFNFDSSTSKALMDSSILDEIQEAYYTIQSNTTSNEEKQNALSNFFKEFSRLKKNWETIEAN